MAEVSYYQIVGSDHKGVTANFYSQHALDMTHHRYQKLEDIVDMKLPEGATVLRTFTGFSRMAMTRKNFFNAMNQQRNSQARETVYEWRGCYVHTVVDPRGRAGYVNFCGQDEDLLEDLAERLFGLAVQGQAASDDQVELTTWWLKNGYASRNVRSILVPSWEQVVPNYSKDVVEEVNRIIELVQEPGVGKIILWHGSPGTGKSFAIRALMSTLKGRYSFNYILDPENFFGSDAGYLADVLIGEVDDYMDDEELKDLEKKKKALYILEDVGEFIHRNAKAQAGQALSRLLNITDGVVGQGIDFRVLMTTNEDITELHPAVTREGRCLSVVHFDKLDREHANQWLESHGSDRRVPSDTSLAELYAILTGKGQDNRSTTIVSREGARQYL